MNRQPYCKPPRWWQPKMSPLWVRLSRGYRRGQLRRRQRVEEVETRNLDALRDLLQDRQGVLITPNHSAHYDSAALYVAADRIAQPLYFLTAWQVFGLSTALERIAMQRIGCFSIDRESNDRQAFKQAVQILRDEPHPLVIFPEGDIYHTNDVVTPFREGAAAIALSAARKAKRPVVALPCGIKFFYTEDPTAELKGALEEIEERLYLRSHEELTLPDRIHRLAESALALKEIDYLGKTREGRVRDRILYLSRWVLEQLELAYGLPVRDSSTIPERVKAVRQTLIRHISSEATDPQLDRQCRNHMEDLFFVMQLFSYRGDYLVGSPTIERIAETVDKFEEDVLEMDLPRVRGRRRVVVQFGEPIPLPAEKQGRGSVSDLTETMQQAVQQILDSLASSSMAGGSDTMQG